MCEIEIDTIVSLSYQVNEAFSCNKGENVDPGFPMRVRMTQLPRLLFPPTPNFEILHSKFRTTDLSLTNLKQLNRATT